MDCHNGSGEMSTSPSVSPPGVQETKQLSSVTNPNAQSAVAALSCPVLDRDSPQIVDTCHLSPNSGPLTPQGQHSEGENVEVKVTCSGDVRHRMPSSGIPLLSVTTQNSLCCFSVLDDTKYALKHLSNHDKLLQVSNWVETASWYTNTCKMVKPEPQSWPDTMVCPCLHNFRSPVVSGLLAGTAVYFTIDTGCSRTLITSKYAQQIFGPNYKKYLMPFPSSFRDAQGNAMVIEGQITGAPLTLGKITIYPTLIIYEAKHCEALLGWDLLVDQKWAVDQEGIWCKYPVTQPAPQPFMVRQAHGPTHHPAPTSPHPPLPGPPPVSSGDKGPQGFLHTPALQGRRVVHPMDARRVPGVPGTDVDSLPPPHAAPQEGWTDVQVTMAGDGGAPAMGLGHHGCETGGGGPHHLTSPHSLPLFTHLLRCWHVNNIKFCQGWLNLFKLHLLRMFGIRKRSFLPTKCWYSLVSRLKITCLFMNCQYISK